MAFQDWVQLSAGKRREINMNRPLARSQSLGCIPKLLSLRLSFRCERGCVILLKRYWITDIVMTTLGLKTLREGGGTSKQVSPQQSWDISVSHWVSVDSLQLLHHWNMQGEKGNVGFGMDFNHRKPTIAQFLLFVSLTHVGDIGFFPGKTV